MNIKPSGASSNRTERAGIHCLLPYSPLVDGIVVDKMEFLLGNPYGTPVGQCIGMGLK